jgi:MoaA/NifB/PqqE/SkfB family radical SAM enzyme
MLLSPTAARHASVRHGCNSWAQHAHNIQAWRRRALADVRPVTLEWSPVLTCNADCPECPFRSSRLSAGLHIVSTRRFLESDDRFVASEATNRLVLERSAEAKIRSVLWTGGGEPTLLPNLPDMCRYSARLGMANALYTNGFLLGTEPGLAERLLEPESRMVFVRISVNAVSPLAVRQHWGVRKPEEVLTQLDGLAKLLTARERLTQRYASSGRRIPSIQISTIIDRKNASDLRGVCGAVADVFSRHPAVRGDEDVMVVRPLTVHRGPEFSDHDHDEAVLREILVVCGARGDGRAVVESAGLHLFLGFGLDLLEAGSFATYSDIVRSEYEQRDQCWAHGLFLTAGPDATVYPCTEMNCNPNYALGNLREQSVEEIFRSDVRAKFLAEADACRWGPRMFQPFSRTTRLDAIARAIQCDELTDGDIEAIRVASLNEPAMLLN